MRTSELMLSSIPFGWSQYLGVYGGNRTLQPLLGVGAYQKPKNRAEKAPKTAKRQENFVQNRNKSPR